MSGKIKLCGAVCMAVFMVLLMPIRILAEEEKLDGQLHAKAAVLVDMDSGRVLYEKNGKEVLPMASTTKIMTCIVALEENCLDETVEASAYAAGQPKVHLGMQKGMKYRMSDLLYSLMLESHNDAAVAIAEHIGGKELQLPPVSERTKEQSKEAVKFFCDRMTKKAKEIGCKDTVFLTPNGLDAEATGATGEKLKHSTTAENLACMMRYCVSESEQKGKFLEITRTSSYTFSDTENKRSYSCVNHNALLTIMEGAISGKTGFTNQAGYCYVGAVEKDDKRFAIALLACGWPGHKSWKWEDSKKLIAYGQENYTYREFMPEISLPTVKITEGAAEDGNPWHEAVANVKKEGKKKTFRLLTKVGEGVMVQMEMKDEVAAPVIKGTEVGSLKYYLTGGDGSKWSLEEEKLYIDSNIDRKDFLFTLRYIVALFCP